MHVIYDKAIGSPQNSTIDYSVIIVIISITFISTTFICSQIYIIRFATYQFKFNEFV